MSDLEMAAEVICCGETMVLLTPADARFLGQAELLRLTIAGAESTVAQYLSNLGHQCAWVSRVGQDPFGQRIVSSLAAQGVDTSLVRYDMNAPTAVFFKDPAPDGSRVYYYRKGSAAAAMSAADVAAVPLAGARLLHLSGITPALSPACAATVDLLFDLARQAGIMVSFDVNYRPGLWPVEQAGPVLRGLADRADIVLVGRDEAETLWGASTAAETRELLDSCPVVIVKDSDVGATEFNGESVTFEPALKVDVIEPVGAGDAFAGGYLSGLLKGMTSAQRLKLGHRLAARALRSLDDYVPVTPDELDVLLTGAVTDEWQQKGRAAGSA
jgi:2-dehydro-3-deoxygluconokinase